jgi:hypothetical protein
VGTTARSLEQRVQDIRRTVLARHGYTPDMPLPLAQSDSPVDESAGLARVNAHWGVVSDLPYVGRLLVLFRRAQRIVLRWYINPIVEQQNAFNDAAVRALYELRAENENLRAELARLTETDAAVDQPGR